MFSPHISFVFLLRVADGIGDSVKNVCIANAVPVGACNDVKRHHNEYDPLRQEG